MMKTQSDTGETDGTGAGAAQGTGPEQPSPFAMREPPGRLGAIVRRLKRMAPPPPYPVGFASPAPSEAD